MKKELTLQEFKNITQGVHNSRNHKIKGSLGIRQAFSFLQKNKWFNIGRSLKEQQFQQIVRQVNILLAYEIMEGRDIHFPQSMGSLELRKYQPFVGFKDGELKVSYPIDWDATLKLWYDDEEAYKNKTLVRLREKEVFKILYNRAKADYENKSFYTFAINRDIKRVLKKRIKQGKIDAFIHEQRIHYSK